MISAGRRKYIHVGFAAASLLQRPAEIMRQTFAVKGFRQTNLYPCKLSLF